MSKQTKLAQLTIEQYRPAPPPPEPKTAAERKKLREIRDKWLAYIETFKGPRC